MVCVDPEPDGTDEGVESFDTLPQCGKLSSSCRVVALGL